MKTYNILNVFFCTLGWYILGRSDGAIVPKDIQIIRKTAYGKVVGNMTDLAQVFYGIPYASPPERWTDPVDPTPWRGRYDASFPKPMCYQKNCSETDEMAGECIPMKSEDCLYLNIFAPPDTKKKSRKAVFFYIHGGSFDWGTGAAAEFNGEMLANKGDVIVLTINYRLGAFGFLVTGNSSDDLTGNYGIKDQRQALKWVQQNIKRFGGDNKKITIAGQSAGAYSTAVHLTSGNVDRLFSRAVIHSNPFTVSVKPLDVAMQQGVTFAQLAGCLENNTGVDTECLKSLTPEKVVEIQSNLALAAFPDDFFRSFLPWIPHIDGVEVKSELLEGFLNTTLPRKELMLGTVRDEGLQYIRRAFAEPLDTIAMLFIVGTFVGYVPTGLVGLYPVANVSDAREELSSMTTDFIYACPERPIARKLESRMSVYRYMFDEPLGFPELLANDPYCIGRVCHSADIRYFFQSARTPPYVFNEEQVAFSDKVLTYLASFVKYGNPNRDLVNGTDWLKYKTRGQTRESTIILKAEEIVHEQDYRGEFCDMWDTTGY